MEDNHYFLDSEHPVEMARLFKQTAMITGICGLFQEGIPELGTRRILDLGCGPGGWVLEVAKVLPSVHITGIDISNIMIDYAQNWAYSQKYCNVSFLMSDFKKLPFSDGYFDLVNATLVQWFIPLDLQKEIFAEWLRVLRPGGIICFTEGSRASTNAQTVNDVYERFERTVDKSSRRVPDKKQQKELLAQRLQLKDVKQKEYVLDFSYGAPDHDAYVRDMETSMERARDYLITMKAYSSEEEYDHLYEKYFVEIDSPGFEGKLPFIVTWGRKR